MAFVSCSDEPAAENYYTSTKEYASDFLMNRGEFSSFSRVLQRGKIMTLLGTYGSYTVFAPTDAAFDKYLAGRGLTSVEELSDADCDTITRTHIIEDVAYYTTDFSEGNYSKTNMLSRVMSIISESDTDEVTGTIRLRMRINKSAVIQTPDDSVENGVVHTMADVIDVDNNMLADVLKKDSLISLFYQAFVATEMEKHVSEYRDNSYTVGSDSTDWTNDALIVHTGGEYDNVAYPKERLFFFTAFVEPDSIYHKHGIHTLDDLRRYAKEIYDDMYPEDAGVTDETDRRNSLNRFVSYHILDRRGEYYTLTCVDGANSTLAKCWDRTKWDIADWYETIMPHSLMKFSFPAGATEGGLYINRRGVMARPDSRGEKIRGAKVYSPSEMKAQAIAVNGVYHYIDDIIHYGRFTQEEVFNERLRFDTSTLSPDFMNSGARGHYTKYLNYENGKYGGQDFTNNATNKAHCLGFKAGYVKNFEYTDATHLHVRPRVLTFWSYQGDEITIKGIFDFKVKLPPVPAGTYEVRFMTCIGFASRGIIQAYFGESRNGEMPTEWIPQGIPFDMRPNGDDPMIGWKPDSEIGDAAEIAAFDKQLHNRGWMRGPHSYYASTDYANGIRANTSFCNNAGTMRKIIGTFESDGKSDYYMRVQQKMNSKDNEMNFDFIELCPRSVYNDDNYPEDRW